MMVTKVVAEGKGLRLAMASQEGVIVRCRLKEAGVQNCEPTCLRAMHRQADEMSYKAGHPGVSQSLKLSEYAKKKISIHMSCGWVVVESAFLRLGHR
jgi:hypothetical protein